LHGPSADLVASDGLNCLHEAIALSNPASAAITCAAHFGFAQADAGAARAATTFLAAMEGAAARPAAPRAAGAISIKPASG
jgi:hypothetical protein